MWQDGRSDLLTGGLRAYHGARLYVQVSGIMSFAHCRLLANLVCILLDSWSIVLGLFGPPCPALQHNRYLHATSDSHRPRWSHHHLLLASQLIIHGKDIRLSGRFDECQLSSGYRRKCSTGWESSGMLGNEFRCSVKRFFHLHFFFVV